MTSPNMNQLVSYKKSVFDMILGTGVRIFGGSVLSYVQRTLKEPELSEKYGKVELEIHRWKPDFHPETWYCRRGDYEDIDFIATYEQLELIKLLSKHGYLKFEFMEKSLIYPVPGLIIKKGETEVLHGRIRSTFPDGLIYPVIRFDTFVCKSEMLSNLYERISKNLDFECNGLCMQLIHENVTVTMMHDKSFAYLISTYGKIKMDIASLKKGESLEGRVMVDVDIYHRVAKMIKKGFFVEFGMIRPDSKRSSFHKLYVFGRSSDQHNCEMCKIKNISQNKAVIYVKINDMIFHIGCYLSKAESYKNELISLGHDLQKDIQGESMTDEELKMALAEQLAKLEIKDHCSIVDGSVFFDGVSEDDVADDRIEDIRTVLEQPRSVLMIECLLFEIKRYKLCSLDFGPNHLILFNLRRFYEKINEHDRYPDEYSR
jgi:hypothetical protein